MNIPERFKALAEAIAIMKASNPFLPKLVGDGKHNFDRIRPRGRKTRGKRDLSLKHRSNRRKVAR
jgi:hypothetical protein